MNNRIVTFGEIMLRLVPPGFERFSQAREFNASFGGGEANVAVSLANFGLDVDYVTRLPKNDIAEACLMELRRYKVGTEKIIFGGKKLFFDRMKRKTNRGFPCGIMKNWVFKFLKFSCLPKGLI